MHIPSRTLLAGMTALVLSRSVGVGYAEPDAHYKGIRDAFIHERSPRSDYTEYSLRG